MYVYTESIAGIHIWDTYIYVFHRNTMRTIFFCFSHIRKSIKNMMNLVNISILAHKLISFHQAI